MIADFDFDEWDKYLNGTEEEESNSRKRRGDFGVDDEPSTKRGMFDFDEENLDIESAFEGAPEWDLNDHEFKHGMEAETEAAVGVLIASEDETNFDSETTTDDEALGDAKELIEQECDDLDTTPAYIGGEAHNVKELEEKANEKEPVQNQLPVLPVLGGDIFHNERPMYAPPPSSSAVNTHAESQYNMYNNQQQMYPNYHEPAQYHDMSNGSHHHQYLPPHHDYYADARPFLAGEDSMDRMYHNNVPSQSDFANIESNFFEGVHGPVSDTLNTAQQYQQPMNDHYAQPTAPQAAYERLDYDNDYAPQGFEAQAVPAPTPVVAQAQTENSVEKRAEVKPAKKVVKKEVKKEVRRGDKAKKTSPVPSKDSDIGIGKILNHTSIEKQRNTDMTMGEIRRRIGFPEYMHPLQVARLARNPKSSKNPFMRTWVGLGFEFEEGNEDNVNITILSCLLEEDAITLAKDYNKIISSELPKDTISSIALSAVGSLNENLVAAIRQYLRYAKDFLLSAGREPSEAASLDLSSPDAQAAHKFGLETHGFGPLAAMAVIDHLTIVLSKILDVNATKLKAQLVPVADMSKNSIVDESVLPVRIDDERFFDSAAPRILHDIEPKEIDITRGELRRRISGPESFPMSLVMTFLRKTKVKEMMPKTKEALEKAGIKTHDKNTSTKKVSNSLFTGLTEKEAISLGTETSAFLSQLPVSQTMKVDAERSPDAVDCLRKIASAISTAMKRVGATPGQRKAVTTADLHLLRFAMITHHFGHTFYASVMDWLASSLQ